MAHTNGMNHLGLTVRDLGHTTAFFVDMLGWEETAHDETYPRTTVTDGKARVTLWQADLTGPKRNFDRRGNIGLHHVAFTVASEDLLNAIYNEISSDPRCEVEFAPEPMGTGPRKHMIFAEPGGLRVELVWDGLPAE